MAQAELHFLRARLQGGKLNKAKKGELRFPLPVGYCYDEQGRIVSDVDEEVRAAVEMVFRFFAKPVAPMQSYSGSWKMAYVFPSVPMAEHGTGRSFGGGSPTAAYWVCEKSMLCGDLRLWPLPVSSQITVDGEIRKRMQVVARPDWRVSFHQHHEGYITLEEFVKNRERLEKNRTNGEETILSGPAREGLALLQGLLLCGNCGHALTVRYRQQWRHPSHVSVQFVASRRPGHQVLHGLPL